MKVLKKNSRHMSALRLLSPPLMILSSLNTFAGDLDATASQLAASATAKQISDQFYSGAIDAKNGGPSNNSIMESRLGYDEIQKTVNKQLDPYVMLDYYFPEGHGVTVKQSKFIWNLEIPLPSKEYNSVSFDTYAPSEAPSPAAYACIKKQLSEISNLPGGLKAALEARFARVHFYFSDFNFYNEYIANNIKSLVVKEGSNSLSKQFAKERSSEKDNDEYNWIEVHSYLDLEGKCHFSSGEKILSNYDATVAAQQEAKKSHSDFENDLKKILPPDKSPSEAPDNSPSQTPKSCLSLDLRSVPVGTKCMTTKGAIFERVSRDRFGEAWRGPDGLIWSDSIGEYKQLHWQTCQKFLGASLPTREEFMRGEDNGFREVLPNMTDKVYLVAWRDTDPFGIFYFFYTFFEKGQINPGDAYNGYHIRCVGR